MTAGSPACVLAIDPGRDKCGLAIAALDQQLLHHEVVPTASLAEHVARLLQQFAPRRVLLGNGTSSRVLRPVVEAAMQASTATLEVVNERHTTERGRAIYWTHHPPRGLRRLVPLGMQVPPEPYDDYAAYCMALDFLTERDPAAGLDDAP